MATMSWTATVGDSYQSGSMVSTLVVLDDGAGNVYRERFLNTGAAKSLKNAVLAWIAARDPVTNALKCVPSGTTVTLDPNPDNTPQPTADEILARDFSVAWRRVLALETADARKWGTVAQQNAVTNQLATARTDAAALYTQGPAVCIPLMRTF